MATGLIQVQADDGLLLPSPYSPEIGGVCFSDLPEFGSPSFPIGPKSSEWNPPPPFKPKKYSCLLVERPPPPLPPGITEPYPRPRIPTELKSEIEAFDRSKLRKPVVYFVSSAKAPYLPQTHGFVAVEYKGATPSPHVRIYSVGVSIMHAAVQVSKIYIAAVLTSSQLTQWTKTAIKALGGQSFTSGEQFLRAVLIEKARIACIDMTDPEVQKAIFEEAAFPNKELQSLISLNQTIRGKNGAILPLSATSKRCLTDRTVVEQNDPRRITKVAYPQIEVLALHQVYQDQQLHARYLEEKAGIGKSTAVSSKMSVSGEQPKGMLSHFSSFKHLPTTSGESNCNKSAASLLQAAENTSATRQRRPAQTIKGPSFWSIAASQRMPLYQPVQQSAHEILTGLFQKAEEAVNPAHLQTLADRKDEILQAIAALPDAQQKIALEETLNPNTALGRVFHKKRSTAFFRESIFSPCQSRGALKKADHMLQALSSKKTFSI